jgi:hypothetical protein
MLRVQKLVPKLPARAQRAMIWLVGRRRFVHWSFDHYLRIAPPEAAGPPPRARDEGGRGEPAEQVPAAA